MAVATGNAPHRDHVHGFGERGRQGGGEVVAGGEFGEGNVALYTPTVLPKVIPLEGENL